MSTNTPMSNIPPLGPPTGMAQSSTPSKFKPIDPVRVMRGNWLWIVLGLIIGLIMGGGVWYALDKYQARFTSTSQFNVQTSGMNNMGVGAGDSSPVDMNQLVPVIFRELQTIKSEPTLRQILNKPVVQNTSWFQQFDNNLDEAVRALDEDVIAVSHIRESPLFAVRATTRNPEDSQTILRALGEEYMRIKDLSMDEDSAQALRAAQGRKDNAEQRIASITVQIKRFLETNPLETINEANSEATIRVRGIIIEQENLEQSLGSLQATYNQLLERQQKGIFDPSDEERAQIEGAREIIQIDNEMRNLRITRDTLLDQFKPGHASIRSIDQRLLAIGRERQAEFDEQARIIFNAKLESAANGVEILAQEMLKTNESFVEWNARRQDYVRLLNDYQTLLRSQQQAERDREDSIEAIERLILIDTANARTVVEEYVPPQKAKKSFPPKPYVMIPGIGLLLMGLATGLVFIREIVDQRVRSAQDVKMISDATLIGMIPSSNQDRDAKTVDRVVELQPSGLLAEAFRQARTAVLSKIDRRGYKTLMMVSAKPGAGVTASAHNMATSCARSGRRVLLIDANFRRPGLARLMSLDGQPGLAGALSGRQPIDDINALVQESDIEGLSLLPAGDTTNAAVELFESPRFRELLAKLEAQYDLLIIDAPPAFLTSDAQLLSRHIDAMVLVSRAQADTRGMLQRLYRELDGQRADILGVLLNGVEASVGGYMKRNFREFHEYSGPERRKASQSDLSRSNGNGAIKNQPPATIQLQEDIAEDVFGDMEDDTKDDDR
ncbi:MAG: polysaccharide biosynthesis tyrosine autokinase [Planctomycetota bacterium]